MTDDLLLLHVSWPPEPDPSGSERTHVPSSARRRGRAMVSACVADFGLLTDLR
jgi:hypothetical protein